MSRWPWRTGGGRMADRRAVLAAALVLFLAGGCGVSQTSGPADLGDAAVAVPFSTGIVKEPESPDGADSPVDLVTRYLQAAVGADEKAVDRVRRFFVPGSQWRPGQVLTVVRLIGPLERRLQGGNRYVVSARVQKIGTLNAGAFEPGADPRPDTLRFTVVGQGTPTQWRLEQAEDGLMISDTTLESLYQPSPVYFWSSDRTHLIPDLRYVPLTMGVLERLNLVVEWQLDGPSPWLAPAVSTRPNVKLKERVAFSGGSVLVNLSSGAASDDPSVRQNLADQLRWTMQVHVTRPLELRVEGQPQHVNGSGNAYLARNAAAVNRSPALFSVDKDGKVVSKSGLRPLAVLSKRSNASVSYAAISSEPYDLAAFVGMNGRKLTIARTDTSEQGGGKVTEVEVKGLTGTIGRPVWIPGDGSEQFLVPAGGRLFVVDTKNKPSAVTPSGITGVTSVSVSPDGRRVALAAGGRAFVSPLLVDRNVMQPIPTQREIVPRRMSVSAVAWVSETKVLVAGANAAGKAALFRVTADGAVAADESPDEAAPLIDVVVFPDRTGDTSRASEIIARTEGAVIYVFSRSVQEAPGLIRPFYAG
jgi:hypothetical protein